MELREFKNLNIKTSLLGFGCMRFPLNKDGGIDEERSKKMIDTAYQQGVNYFDTAYTYHDGKSEIVTGKILDQYDRNTYYLATKLPLWLVNSLEDAERLFNEQLKKLHKDYIDFYLLHAFNRDSFQKMVKLGVIDFMDRLKEEGKIRYIGFSFHDDYDVFETIIKHRHWDFCQIQLNYMDTDIQAGLKGYQLSEELGVPLVIMEPVKGGSLAKLPDNAVDCFKTVTPGKSPASWALRWVGSLPNVKVILSGMSDEEQVQDNLNTFKHFTPLSEEEQKAVKEVATILKNRVRNGCTGCNYCMPCPAGVNIPRNFRVWNEYGRYENKGEARWLWNSFEDDQKAKNCVECGQCEEACPQKLNIRQDLKALQEEFDTICATK
ncbi:aldo/keto reductase [Lachnospiraceae bacterium MD1]|uniref:Aldo/keto reductase n=1 Tax=Variimorphobacter saccharofermentans TaxID=2755051 RepID=A0A839JYH2_9FIRM|nr:aldo/keto reductase [Variimorphobacter saccharofermentans]MBB2182404.1 aldo/keto reductase [Variimorphobacter saccharofermentans]